ncbi:hypothetical protein D3C73_833880 [compost metagenome]
MTTELFPTSSFADALVSMALDDKIGRRTTDEIDIENIYRTYNDIVDYFGTPLAAEFCTTIDDTNLSFEELVTNLCDASFVQHIGKTISSKSTSNNQQITRCCCLTSGISSRIVISMI